MTAATGGRAYSSAYSYAEATIPSPMTKPLTLDACLAVEKVNYLPTASISIPIPRHLHPGSLAPLDSQASSALTSQLYPHARTGNIYTGRLG